MERNGPSGENQEPKKPTTGVEWPSFLATWFERDRLKDTSEHKEEEDNNTESEGSTGRFRKFFRKLFRRTVEQPSFTAADQVEQPRSRVSEFLLGRAPATEEEKPQNTESYEQATPYTYEVPTEAAQAQPRTEAESVTIDAENTQNSAENLEAEPDLEPYQRPLFEYAPRRDGELVIDHTADRREPTQTRIVERNDTNRIIASTAAIAGVEYLANRHTVNKAERKVSKEVKKLEKQTRKTTEAVERVERATQRQTEQLERVVTRPVAERVVRPEKPVVVAEQPHPSVEQKIVTEVQEAIPNTDRYAERKVAPTVVLERVAEAAEHDEPLERTYERRQEIKDDAAVLQGVSGATAVGDVLSRAASNLSAAAQVQSAAQQFTERQLRRSAVGQDQYARAVHDGLVAGVVIVVFVVLAYVATQWF